MNKGVVSALVAVLLVAALVVGVPYYCGLRFEQQFRSSVAEAGKVLPFPIEITKYERSLFGATAETQLTIKRDATALPLPAGAAPAAPAAPPYIVVLHQVIEHGPRLDSLHAIRVTTTLQLPAEAQQKMDALLKGQPVFIAVNDVGFNNAVSGTMSSPAFETTVPAADGTPAQNIAWSGVVGKYSVAGDRLSAKVYVTMPKFAQTSDIGSITVEQTHLTVDMNRGTASGIWLGDSGFTIGSVGGMANGKPFEAGTIELKTTTTETGGAVTSSAALSAQSIKSGEQQFDHPLFRMSVANLDSAAMLELSETVNKLNAGGGDPAAKIPAMMAAMKTFAARTAARKPMFSIDELSVSSAAGAAKFAGSVQYTGSGDIETFSPATDVAAKGTFEMPVAMFDAVMKVNAESDLRKQQQLGGGEIDDKTKARIAQQAEAVVRTGREQLIAQKMLILDGDRLKATADFQGGMLLVNGAPLQGFSPNAPPIPRK